MYNLHIFLGIMPYMWAIWLVRRLTGNHNDPHITESTPPFVFSIGVWGNPKKGQGNICFASGKVYGWLL
jgi:hypothetical protein